MNTKRRTGKVVDKFNSFEEVKEKIKKELYNEFDWVKKIEYGNPEVFRKNEIRRTKVIINGNYDWDIYIPFEELEFWNGMYSKKSNFRNKVSQLKKTIRYYNANGSK